jgi:DNA mismatch repair protein MutS2
MHAGALKALEFDRIVEALGTLALTPLGAARLADLRPMTDPARVEAALAATTEGVVYLADNPVFPLRAPSDFEATLASLAVEGRALEPLQLVGLVEFLASVETARAAVRRAARQALPILRAVVEAARSFDREIADVRQKIEPSGEVLDTASPDLRSIRDRLRKQRNRLRTTLESYLRGRETARYLQEQIVTDRNGRFVLLVKSEHRASIPGIVHGSSGSGATLFLEPLSTVEINNDVVALEQQEAEEVRRILLALSDQFRSRAADLQRTLEAATELDVIQAKARFSQIVDGIPPGQSPDGRLELRAARHPLLIGEVAARGGEAGTTPRAGGGPVAVDILVIPPLRVLVITGPNTGGKTVALKTAGLLAAMAQAGLHVPAAEGTRLPVFRSIFADIGDEQSIAASLSTFSSHITNIAAMDRALSAPALVLLDEIGAGTDPVEGGALGMALLEHFKRRGALVIATTHYDMLKSYASTTTGVTSAAFGFDPETFAPTYRLIYGSPGRSLALEIAARLGLSPGIVAEAREHRSAREAQLASHLAKVESDLHALEQDRRALATERQALADREAALRAQGEALLEREGRVRQRLDRQFDERLREARHDIDRIVDDLKRQVAELAAEAARRGRTGEPGISTGETGAPRAGARAALQAVEDKFREEESAPAAARVDAAPSRPAAVGDRVTVGGLGLEGTVIALTDRDAEVDVRGKRLRVSVGELRIAEGKGPSSPARVDVRVNLQPREPMSTDLNVIGCTVDEALSRVEKFLDEAVMAEQRSVRLIHGYGTGQLRRAIADFLHNHPFVASFGAAPPERGGGGVTVAELKE